MSVRRARRSSSPSAVSTLLAETLGHRGESRLPRRDDRARGIVGIDHGNPELCEALLDRALAARDSAGEADAQARGAISAEAGRGAGSRRSASSPYSMASHPAAAR